MRSTRLTAGVLLFLFALALVVFRGALGTVWWHTMSFAESAVTLIAFGKSAQPFFSVRTAGHAWDTEYTFVAVGLLMGMMGAALTLAGLLAPDEKKENAVTADPECLFCKIFAGEIPAAIVAKNDEFLCFRDINPQAPVHWLCIPRTHLPRLSKAEAGHADTLGRLLVFAAETARQQGVDDYRLVVNNGEQAGQTVWHLHVHLLAGRDLTWPPG